MAKKAAAKSDVNKSEAIRQYLRAHRNAKPKAVVEALKEQGIRVNSQTVSTVKFHMKRRRGKKGAAGRKTAAAAGGEMVSLSALLDAKKLVNKLGGIEKAKSALDALNKLG